MNPLSDRLPEKESLTVEFKSDRQGLSDKDLIEALVCLANSEGGELWLGVEDNGTPSGLHAKHQSLTGLAGLVAARTSPSLSVTVHEHFIGEIKVAKIVVPKTPYVVATLGGVYTHRRLKSDGTPECVPMLPHEQASRQTFLGLSDASARAVPGATLADFDPLERERLRQTIRRYGGDRVLLELDDEALEGALNLSTRNDRGERVPTLAGLLIIGRESALRELVATHEIAFQVLAREAVQFNEFQRFPLLKAMDWLETNFRPYNPEEEMQIGLFRMPIPKVDTGAFREALANALIHRDYHKMGTVFVRLHDDYLTISNPGGLIDGVTVDNLLTTEPRPRNPALADAMKRIGLVERSGRGVDKIYRGVLKFGRPQPDYSHTDHQAVVVQLATTAADTDFLHWLMDWERKTGHELSIDGLIVLSVLRTQKRLDADDLSHHIQRDTVQTRRILESLLESGLIQAHGNGRGRSYTLSANLYRADGQSVAYTRQAGFNELQREQMILGHIAHHGRITRTEVIELCRMNEREATRLLKKLTQAGKIIQHGQRRWTFYTCSKSES